MKLQIIVALKNAALADDPRGELARILRIYADKLENRDELPEKLLDLNGNTVGTARFTR